MQYKDGEISSIDDSTLPQWEKPVRQGGFMNTDVMSKNLLDFKDTMDKFQVPFVLIFGCLLGIVREGNFIKHDTDVDVACFNEFVRRDHWKLKNIKEDLKNKGFRIIGNDECYLHIDFFIRNGEKIEIWWFDKIDSEWIFGDTVRYPAYYFDILEEVSFLGTIFKVPNNPKEFVKLTYGNNYMIPNPKAKWLNLNPKAVEKRQ